MKSQKPLRVVYRTTRNARNLQHGVNRNALVEQSKDSRHLDRFPALVCHCGVQPPILAADLADLAAIAITSLHVATTAYHSMTQLQNATEIRYKFDFLNFLPPRIGPPTPCCYKDADAVGKKEG